MNGKHEQIDQYHGRLYCLISCIADGSVSSPFVSKIVKSCVRFDACANFRQFPALLAGMMTLMIMVKMRRGWLRGVARLDTMTFCTTSAREAGLEFLKVL